LAAKHPTTNECQETVYDIKSSFERLFGQLELEFANNLLAIIRRVITAVQSFLRSSGHARRHRLSPVGVDRMTPHAMLVLFYGSTPTKALTV